METGPLSTVCTQEVGVTTLKIISFQCSLPEHSDIKSFSNRRLIPVHYIGAWSYHSFSVLGAASASIFCLHSDLLYIMSPAFQSCPRLLCPPLINLPMFGPFPGQIVAIPIVSYPHISPVFSGIKSIYQSEGFE